MSSVFAFGGLPPELDQADFNEHVARAQAVYFFTLVFMQWGNLLATRTRRLSIFQHNPFWGPNRNLFVPCAMACSAAFVFFFSYVPFFQKAFVTRVSDKLPLRSWRASSADIPGRLGRVHFHSNGVRHLHPVPRRGAQVLRTQVAQGPSGQDCVVTMRLCL